MNIISSAETDLLINELDLFTATRTVHPRNAHLLLYGNSQLSLELNIMIVDAVHKYIKNTKPFNHC